LKLLVTGGAGFIRSNLIRSLLTETDTEIVNVDKLLFRGSLYTMQDFQSSSRYSFEHAEISFKILLKIFILRSQVRSRSAM